MSPEIASTSANDSCSPAQRTQSIRSVIECREDDEQLAQTGLTMPEPNRLGQLARAETDGERITDTQGNRLEVRLPPAGGLDISTTPFIPLIEVRFRVAQGNRGA